MSAFEIPTSMRAAVLHAYDALEQLVVTECPVPRPQAGQVLIRMHASPINPSDLATLRGVYSRKKLPAIPGIEGSGVVVAAGSGWMARGLVGRRVACIASGEGASGTWAEYMLAPATTCIPLKSSLSLEQGAMHFVNPFTAWLLLAEARRAKLRTIMQTAAAGALGKMLIRLAAQYGIASINIVRREEQAETLRALGANYILNSSAADFDARLHELCHTHNVRLAFDAVGGELTGKLLSAMPNDARLISYGALALQPLALDPRLFIATGKSLAGFHLGRAMTRLNMPARLQAVRQVRRLLAHELHSNIQARVPLADLVAGIQRYTQNMSAGKVLLMLQRDAAQ